MKFNSLNKIQPPKKVVEYCYRFLTGKRTNAQLNTLLPNAGSDAYIHPIYPTTLNIEPQTLTSNHQQVVEYCYRFLTGKRTNALNLSDMGLRAVPPEVPLLLLLYHSEA